MARRHPVSVGNGIRYTPKLFSTESPHHFMTSVSIQAAMKMSPSALMPNNLLGVQETCISRQLLKMEAICSSRTLTIVYETT
jgi:hypothetical protein